MKLFAVLFVLFFPVLLYCQDEWIKLNGPGGGSIKGLVAKGDTILAGTGYGKGLIFYSTDRGNHWAEANYKFTGPVSDFAFTSDGGVLAAAGSKGIIKSFDLKNWFDVFSYQNKEFYSIGFGETGNLYAGSDPNFFVSTDNGLTWSFIFANPFGVRDLVSFGGKTYASGGDFVCSKVEPNGLWEIVLYYNGYIMYHLAQNQNTIFAPNYGQFNVSTDNGMSWSNRDTNNFFHGEQLLHTIFNNRLIGACEDLTYYWFGDNWGAVVSDDHGYNWRLSNTGILSLTTGTKLAASGNDTFLGTENGGVYKSTDFGDTWTSSSLGLNAANVYNIHFDENENLYAAARGSGVYKSTDKGMSWTRLVSDLFDCYINDVFPYNGLLFVGTYYGFFKSTDDGQTWSQVNGMNCIPWKFYTDAQNRLYFIECGIYRSTNSGTSWVQIANGFPTMESLAFDSSGNIYAGTWKGKIFKSTNDGATWVQKFYLGNELNSINGLCVAPNGTLFATNWKYGILRSTDEGETWQRVKIDDGDQNWWPIECSKNGVVYTSTRGGNFFSSTDNGDTWQNISGNAYKCVAKDIIFDKDQFVYMATDEGIWRSLYPTPVELISFTAYAAEGNITLSWQTASETNNKGFEIQRKTPGPSSLEGVEVNWTILDFVNGAGTAAENNSYSYIDKNPGTGKYTYRLKQVDFNGSFEYSKEIDAEINTPVEFSLRQNYPNPFNPTTIIEFSLPQEENVNLSLYSMLGEKLKVLINEKMTEGMHKYTLDAAALPSGVYVYRIKAGGFVDTKKLLLLK